MITRNGYRVATHWLKLRLHVEVLNAITDAPRSGIYIPSYASGGSMWRAA